MARYVELARRAAPEKDDVEHALDRAVAAALPVASLALAGLYAALAPIHLFLLRYPERFALAGITLLTSVLFLSIRALIRRYPVPDGWGHALGGMISLFIVVVGYFHLTLSGEARETLALVLIIIGVGLFFLDIGWFAVVVAAVFTAWLIAAAPNLTDPEWTYFGVVMIIATVLSGTVLVIRRDHLARVERFRSQERVRQVEIEVALDQTERARQEGERARRSSEAAIVQVRESEERFRRLAEATFEGVVFYRDGRILDANPRAAQILRVSVAQMVGDPILNLVAPEHATAASELLLGRHPGTETGASETRELECRRYDGTLFPTELAVVDSFYRGEDARVVVVRDVTNQRRAEQMLRRALEEAEANSQAKSSFLANMSHELRTPLNSVIGFANILIKRDDGSMNPRQRDYLRRIQANGEHLLALIEDILDVSKIDARRMEVVREPVDLEELVADVSEMLDIQLRRRGLELVREVPPDLRPAVGDHRRLKQVILNLAGNAVKFTPEGAITLRVEAESGTSRPLRIAVIDTGIGIPPDELDDIFAPFHQVDGSQARSFGGTGLGLAISRSLCELMGFELNARSEVGVGSVFEIDLEPGRHPTPAAMDDAAESGPA